MAVLCEDKVSFVALLKSAFIANPLIVGACFYSLFPASELYKSVLRKMESV